MLENRVVRRVSGPKREDVTGGERKLHNYESTSLEIGYVHYWRCEIRIELVLPIFNVNTDLIRKCKLQLNMQDK